MKALLLETCDLNLEPYTSVMVQIVQQPIEIQEVLRAVQTPEVGAIDVFIGTTRNQSGGKGVLYLEYETYEPMALTQMDIITKDIRERWSVHDIAIVHRVGRLDVGEASVVIAVSAGHRREAFEACRYAIDTLKKDVPIWKKEVFEDGEAWVGRQTDIPRRG